MRLPYCDGGCARRLGSSSRAIGRVFCERLRLGGRGFDWATLQSIEHMVLAQSAPTSPNGTNCGSGANDCTTLLQPDLTFWFDLPAATAAQRIAGRQAADRFEAESEAFFNRVAAAYARRAAEAPQRIVRIDAAQSPENVWQQIQTTLQQRGWL